MVFCFHLFCEYDNQHWLCLHSSSRRQLCVHSCCFFYSRHSSCLLMCFTCCTVHELYLSLCLLFWIISSMWMIVPAKPWWSIETFGMLIPPKRRLEWQSSIGQTVTTFLAVLALNVCSDNKLVFLLSTFSQSGSLNHWFVSAYHSSAVFNNLSPNCVEWCTRFSEKLFL